jgi:hypothetical protein
MTREQQLEYWAGFDVSCWYQLWAMRTGLCPNCGIEFRSMHPAQNLFPHFTAACKAQQQADWQKEFD